MQSYLELKYLEWATSESASHENLQPRVFGERFSILRRPGNGFVVSDMSLNFKKKTSDKDNDLNGVRDLP